MPRLAGDIPYRLLGGGQPTQACNRKNTFLANPQSKDHHGSSLFFDGIGDAAIIFGNVDLEIANEWSIMLWVAPTNLAPASDMTLFSIGTLNTTDDNGIDISIEAGGTFACTLFSSSGLLFKKRSIAAADTSTTVTSNGFFFGPNIWHQIVLTWDGAAMTVYRNGVDMDSYMATEADLAGSQTNTNRSIAPCSRYAFPLLGNKAECLLHSTAHWNVVLSGAEITETYNAGRGGEFNLNAGQGDYTSEASLKSWYKFGEHPSSATIENNAPTTIEALASTQTTPEKYVRSAPEGSFLRCDGIVQYSQYSGGPQDFDIGPSLTIGAWARAGTLPGEGETQTVVLLRELSGTDLVHLAITTTGGVSRWVFEVSDSTNTITNTVVGTTAVVEDTWYHILGCKNSAFSIRFFVNGVDDVFPIVAGVGVTSTVGRHQSIGYDGRLGYAPAGGHNNFFGDIHSIAIWNVPVSENGVKAIYDGGWADLDLRAEHPCYSESSYLTTWWLFGRSPEPFSPGFVEDMARNVVRCSDGFSSPQRVALTIETSLVGNSANFDDSNGLGMITALPVGISNAFSISAWVQPLNLSTDKQQILYIGPQNPSTINAISWRIEGDTVGDPFVMEVMSSSGTVLQRRNFSDMFALEEWVHIIMVWTGSTIVAYKNGKYEAGVVVAAGAGAVTDTSRFVDIGGSEHAEASIAAGLKFVGRISHVGIWDTILSSNETATIGSQGHSLDLRYNKQDYQSGQNLIHYYKLGEDLFLKGRDFMDTMRGTGLSQMTLESGSVGIVGDTPGSADSINPELKSVLLNGTTQYYLHDTNSDFDIANAWTVSAWAKSDATFPFGGDDTLFNIETDGLADNKIQCLSEGTGAVRVTVNDLNGALLWDARYLYVFSDNEWNHVIVRWDGTNIDVYFNNSLQNPDVILTDGRPGSMDDLSGRKIGFGADINGLTLWEGQLGHLGIFDSALNQANITEIYNGNHLIDLTANFGNYIQSGNLRHYYRPGYVDEGFDDESLIASPVIDLEDSVGITVGNIVVNAPPETVQGSDRSVLTVGSDQYTRTGDVTYQMGNAWSVGFWAKHPDPFPSSSRNVFQLSPSGTFNSGIFFGMDGLGQISFSTGKTGGAGILWAGVWNYPFNDSDWHHFLFTWDGVAIDMHIDGVYTPASSTSFDGRPGTMADDARQIGFGGHPTGAGVEWAGNLGHLGLWSTALTPAMAAEIAAGGHLIDLRVNQGAYTGAGSLQHYYRAGWNLGMGVNGLATGTRDESTIAYNGGNQRHLVNTPGIDDSNAVEDAPPHP